MDIAKLTQLPLEIGIPQEEPGQVRIVGSAPVFFARFVGSPEIDAANEAEFYVLARNAFDVMMRRAWMAVPDFKIVDGFPMANGWVVASWSGARVTPDQAYSDANVDLAGQRWPDPFTALVAADAWYKANVEAAST